jgi:RNA polymerase sigma-70 factor (ECF subfamily)
MRQWPWKQQQRQQRSRDSDSRDSIALLYQDYAPNVLGLLVKLCRGDRAEAEDLTQETFIAAYQALDGYSGKGSPRSWLLGIAFRRWRDRTRRLTLPTETLVDEKHAGAWVSGSVNSLETQVIRDLTLDAGLRELPEQHRWALLLVVSQQLTYREAATILDEPAGTIKWRVHEALRQMRHYFQAIDQEIGQETEETNNENALETLAKRPCV